MENRRQTAGPHAIGHVDTAGAVVARATVPTPATGDPEVVLGGFAERVAKLLAEARERGLPVPTLRGLGRGELLDTRPSA